MQQLESAGTEYSTAVQAAAAEKISGSLRIENGSAGGSAAAGASTEEHK